jgi:hypothetical protein
VVRRTDLDLKHNLGHWHFHGVKKMFVEEVARWRGEVEGPGEQPARQRDRVRGANDSDAGELLRDRGADLSEFVRITAAGAKGNLHGMVTASLEEVADRGRYDGCGSGIGFSGGTELDLR